VAVSIAQADALLGGLPSPLYVQPHSGDPGAAGTLNVIAGAQRGTVTIPASSGGQRSVLANVDCPGVPALASVSWVSYWTAPSGGTFRFSEPLGGSVTFAYAGTLRFTSQIFTVTTDAAGGSQTQTTVVADSNAGVETNVTRLFIVVADSSASSDSAMSVIPHTDSTASLDANATRLGVVVTDSTAQSDTAAGGGTISDVADTTSASDANAPTQILRSAVADTGSAADSNAASEQGAASENPFAFAPDALLAYTETSGTPLLINVQDDPDVPDANWIISQGFDRSPTVRVSFPTPPGTLTTGADKQEFRAALRRFTSAKPSTPTARLELWQNGALVRAGADTTITSDTGQVISLLWDASELTTDPSGAQVECKVVVTESQEPLAADRNSADIGAVEWVGTASGYVDLLDDFVGVDESAIDASKWTAGVVSGGGSITATVNVVTGTGGLRIVRTAASPGAVRVASVGTFTNEVGRYIKIAEMTPVATGGQDNTLALVGSYVYEFEPVLGEIEWIDDPGYYTTGPAVVVTKRNAATDALISTATLNPLIVGAWPAAGAELLLVFGAGTVDVTRADTGLLLGQASIADLGASFQAGFTARGPSTVDVAKACSRIEVGRQ
jgi:hypothetical protein